MIAYLFCLSVFLLGFQEPGSDEIVRLRDGRLIVGDVVDHDLDGLQVVSALHGGRYQLEWSDLFPGESDRLKLSFGYAEQTTQPTVTADRLLLKSGQQFVGRILTKDNRSISLQQHGNVVTILRSRLAAPPEKVLVPAAEVMTSEQFYNERLLEVDVTNGLRNFEFAQELRAVRAYEKALEHMALAADLASAAEDQALLARVQVATQEIEHKLAHRQEADALDQVREEIHRQRFVKALEILDGFEEKYPNSGLRGEYLDLRDYFLKQRKIGMEKYLISKWFRTALGILKRRSVEQNVDPLSLADWAENEVPVLVRKVLLNDLKKMKEDVDEDELDTLWATRFEHTPARHQASFGNGTFILGEDRALAGLVEEESADDQNKTPEMKELEARTKRYLENLERQRRKATGDEGYGPEDWWRKATSTEHFQWLLAYYAEFSGDFKITRVRFDNCPTCGGVGTIRISQVTAQGAQEQKRKCPTCQGVSKKRAVTFQ